MVHYPEGVYFGEPGDLPTDQKTVYNYQLMWENLEKRVEADRSLGYVSALMEKEENAERVRSNYQSEVDLFKSTVEQVRRNQGSAEVVCIEETEDPDLCRIYFSLGESKRFRLSKTALKRILRDMSEEWIENL